MLVTFVVTVITIVIRETCFPSRWKPIEKLRSQIPNDHELMVDAKRRAAESLPHLWSLCANGVPSDAKVRVQFTDRSAESEELWMFLLALPNADGQIHVHLFERPQLVDYDFVAKGDIDFYVHQNQIVDWSLEQSDGTIRGDFTTFALFKFFEQSIGPLPKRTQALQELFLDAREL
jgi:hypothetical protein